MSRNRFQQLRVQKSIDEVIEDFETADRLVRDAYRLIAQADELMDHYKINVKSHIHNRMNTHPDSALKRPRRNAWIHIMDLTRLSQVMDKKAVEEFQEQINKNPPPLNRETVEGTLLSKLQESDHMFSRGLVGIFKGLSGKYTAHKDAAFKVPKKVIIQRAVETQFNGQLAINSNSYTTVNDIDRVFKTLDGLQFKEYALIYAMTTAWQSEEVYECDMYRARAYAIGTLHLEFKRPDLLDKANEIIEQWYGPALGGGKK